MEIRIKVSDDLHFRLVSVAKSHEIPITSQVKLYITKGLQKDEVRRNDMGEAGENNAV